MFIEQLDKTRLLITLEHEDLSVFDLEPDAISMEDKNTRNLFKQLLTLAAVKTGITIKDKIISVDLMPYNRGCFILVTIKTKSERKLYRIKKTTTYLLVKFSSAGDMLDAVKQLYRKGCASYGCNIYAEKDNGIYYILLLSKALIPKSVRILLSEYGMIQPCNRLTVSTLEESCTALHKINSIAFLGEKL